MNPAANPSSPGAYADPRLKAAVLAEALPYMRRYAGQTLVVKYGGHAMGEGGEFVRPRCRAAEAGRHQPDRRAWRRAADRPYAGAPRHQEPLCRRLRVTDRETMEVVEMVLAGTINKQLVAAINAEGGCAIGLTGKDGGLIAAKKAIRTRFEQRRPDRYRSRLCRRAAACGGRRARHLQAIGHHPGHRADRRRVAGETYNINADTVAGAVAAAVKATRLLLLTDVAGRARRRQAAGVGDHRRFARGG